MKRLIYLTSTVSFLTASNLIIQKLKVEDKNVLHLTLKSSTNIYCDINKNFELRDKIKCKSNAFDKNITIDKSYELFDLKVEDDYVVIEPKYQYKVLGRDKAIYDKKIFSKINNKTIVDLIFFKEKLDFLDSKSEKGLDFTINFNKNQDFLIGVLNDELKPIISINDVSKIDFLKKLYNKGDYIAVIKKSTMELQRNNIYASDILLYKIRALDKILDDKNEKTYTYQDMENSCDDFIERYSSNKHLSEIIYYKLKSLYRRGKQKEALAFVHKLENNFSEDLFTEKALVLKAKNLFIRKKYQKTSNKILEKLLYSTKHVDIALESAFLLVGNNLKEENYKKAKEFLEKILKYKQEYLKENFIISYNYAKKFAKGKQYKEAVKIAEILSKNKEDEELDKNLAYWTEKAGLKEKAYKKYREYLKKYPKGRYVDFIKERLDKVLLDIKDKNSSKKLKDIDNILNKYSKEPIYKKALIEKVKLYINQKDYKSVLELEKDLQEINATKYLNIASKALFDSYMSKNDCSNSIKLVNKYKIVVDSQKLYNLVECYYSLANYKDAYELSKKYIQSQNAKELSKWYYIAIKSTIKLRDYTTSIKLYEDIVKIIDVLNSKYKDIYFDMFQAYYGLKYIDKSLEVLKVLEKDFPKNPKLLDIYYKLIKYYKDKKDDLTVTVYAKKLLELQKDLKVQIYSPMVDIILIKSLKNLSRYKKSLSYFADAYLSKNITDTQKAQLLYLAGEISLKMKKVEQAKEFFIKCGTDIKNEMWQNICSDSLKLIEEK